MPPVVNRLIKKFRLSGKAFTALRMNALIGRRIKLIKDFFSEVDHFIVLCEWTRNVLLRNKVPAQKIALICHGIAYKEGGSAGVTENISAGASPLKIAYLGRIDLTKGLEPVIKAFKYLPGEPVELDIYGIAQGYAANRYLQKLKRIAGHDNRISFFPPVPSAQTVLLLKKYHYLVVPSVGMETGPLVVLESFAAGTPIIGSKLGGIKELVDNGRSGILVPINSPKGWRETLKRAVRDRHMLVNFRGNIKPPSTMREVAEKIIPLYNKFIPS